ncbi:hypothetical protein [Nonomuraea recticatena]
MQRSGSQKGDVAVRVFVAGGAGVGGRWLVPRLVARDGQVKPTTRNPGKPGSSETLVEVVRSRPRSLVGDGLEDAANATVQGRLGTCRW